MEKNLKMPKILIVDDEPYICEILKEILAGEGYTFETAQNGQEALEKYSMDFFDLVLLDITMPKMGGIELLSRLFQIDRDATVIMATAQRDVETVVEAIKNGAEDYIVKPFIDISFIKATVRKALKVRAIKDENRYLRQMVDVRSRAKNLSIIGNCSNMQELYKMIQKVAPLDTTILLVGDTGAGKELVAKAIHQCSTRYEKKFISVNCGGIPETLLESTLFGYEKGAFTGAFKRTKGVFEEAEGGTLFLDEIGETSPALQVRFLRVLQDKTYQRVGGTETIRANVRIISATNKDIHQEVKNGKFREDLYYRLNIITLFLPPLRDRREDIPLLIKHFLSKHMTPGSLKPKEIDEESMNILVNWDWPGNVRELESVIERAIALSDSILTSVKDLPDYLKVNLNPVTSVDSKVIFSVAKGDFERNYLSAVLERTGWNVSKAAIETGIPRQNLYLKIKKFGLKNPNSNSL